MMTHYDSQGRPVERVSFKADIDSDVVYDVGEVLDRGVQPDFEKDSLNGQTVMIFGIKGPEDFPMGPVYFVLLKRAVDPREAEPWGVMFPASNRPMIPTILDMATRGRLPFPAVLRLRASESNKGYEYWDIARPPLTAVQTAAKVLGELPDAKGVKR